MTLFRPRGELVAEVSLDASKAGAQSCALDQGEEEVSCLLEVTGPLSFWAGRHFLHGPSEATAMCIHY